MFGAIAGDILGSVHEFNPLKTKDFELFNPNCMFTDDTVMTIAVADAAMNHEPYSDALQTWGRRYPFAGYGSWFGKWIFSETPEPYNSFGNGSAMRVSSIGWLYDEEDKVLEEASKSAGITHNHPEGIKGAQAIALGIYLARNGATKPQIKEKLESTFGYELSRTLDKIRPGYFFDLTCPGSVPQAIIAFLESTDFEDAIRNAVSLGGDADTQACISGALAEAHYLGIPEDIQEFVIKRITPEMLMVLQDFQQNTRLIMN